MTIRKAPWTKDEVKQLEGRQTTGHPYTCPEHSNNALEPTTEGWVCPNCDYTQDWCHETDVTTTTLDFYENTLDDGTRIQLNITEEMNSAYLVITRSVEPNETPNILQTIENGKQRTVLRLPLETLFTIIDMAITCDFEKIQKR